MIEEVWSKSYVCVKCFYVMVLLLKTLIFTYFLLFGIFNFTQPFVPAISFSVTGHP